MLRDLKKGILEDFQLDLCKRIEHFSEIITRTTIVNDQQQIYPLEKGVLAITQLLSSCRENQGMTYIIGNGGSASIASHVAIDLLNTTKLRAITLHEAASVTCISNDYGYEEVYREQLKQLLRPDDVLIAISSSGKSKNILNAVSMVKSKLGKVITFSGFSSENPLRKMGDINLWLDSEDYGFVEIGHAFILHNITDKLKLKEDMQ